jgi:glycolate oxidase iron-sulfur subunit
MVDEGQKYRELAELADEIARCGRCGFCQSVCPVYNVSADESGVARGRNMFAKELISGGFDLSGSNEAFLTECLLCRACVDVCFSEVKTDEVVLAGRRSQRRIHGTSPFHKYIFERLLPDHRKLGRVLRLVSKGNRARLMKVAAALRMFGWFGSTVVRAEEFSRDLPKEFFRERLTGREIPPGGSKRASLFIGCGTNFMAPHVGEATLAILEGFGYDVDVVDHGCCGLPAFVHGEVETARKLAMRNIIAFSSEPDRIIITDCSSCASFLKDYHRLLQSDDIAIGGGIRKAEGFPSRVRDITEILAEEKLDRLQGQREIDEAESRRIVTFHDPCHLSRYQHLSLQARDVIRSLPGIGFVEMKEADWCCGGAGAFAIEHPELSIEILERKARNIRSSGAALVATTCPSCLMQIRSGLTRAGLKGPDVHVRHLVEIVREQLLKG